MEQNLENDVKEIMGGLMCPKGFKCYKQGFENLCKAKDIATETYLVCLEERPHDCKLSMSFDHSYLCTCPLRVYIAKKLGK